VVILVVVVVMIFMVRVMMAVPLIALPPAVTVPIAVAVPAHDRVRARHHGSRPLMLMYHRRSRLDVDRSTSFIHVLARQRGRRGRCGEHAKGKASSVASEHDLPPWKKSQYLQSTAAISFALCHAG
jgi:hypothetical protein